MLDEHGSYEPDITTEMVSKVTRLPPNYFLGFRINNPLIHQKSQEIQKLAVDENPLFAKALTSGAKLHITLKVFSLPEEKDVSVVSDILNKWASLRRDQVFKEPLHISIQGIGYFSGGVIFANVVPDESYSRLCSIAEELSGLITEAGYSGDTKKLTPHVTLLKLSKHRSLYKLKKEFKALSENLMKTSPDFGIQEIESIQLLSMKLIAPDGYYQCAQEITASQSIVLPQNKEK